MALKILIVDDEEDLIEVLTDRLESYGFEVFSAGNGLQALHILAKEKFDGIFLDLRMPGLDGFGTLEQIREADKATPIIIITASSNKEAAIAAEAKGANECLMKPFDWEELKAKIAKSFRVEV
jgi:DNA-binding response OmpR family regulator